MKKKAISQFDRPILVLSSTIKQNHFLSGAKMIPNYFSVWFETKKVRDKNFAKLVSNYALEQYFEECWDYSQQAFIDSKMDGIKTVIEELQWDKEDLEWDKTELDYDKADLEAEIQTLLSRIVFLEEQLQGK